MIKTFDMSSGEYDEVETIQVAVTRDEIRQPTAAEMAPVPGLQLQQAVARTIPVYQHGCPALPVVETVTDETAQHVLH